MKIPTWSPGKVPQKTQSFAEASITSERGNEGVRALERPAELE